MEPLSDGEITAIVERGVRELEVAGRKVLVLIPDGTRTFPTALLFRLLAGALGERAARADFLVALGTHQPMSAEQLSRHLGITESGRRRRFPKTEVYNHRWDNPAALAEIGRIPAAEIRELTAGRFVLDVPVTVNRLLLEYDLLLILGPVFPHEVVGFSGGNKYVFPGVSGPEFLNFFHWFAAVITCPKIIGNKHTPVRALIDRAARLLPIQRAAFCGVVHEGALCGLFFGTSEQAWSDAADLSERLHIVYEARPFESVLARAPEMYDDIWTAGKCMYKLEPVVADGGELIIWAPHVTEISHTHGKVLDEIGYHTRDFFLAQWARYKRYPWGVLAHSTHVRGIGTCEAGVEKPRIRVTLATGIPEERCRRVNLGYRAPASIRPAEWQAAGRLYVPKAGETLYRLRKPPAWQQPEQA